MSERQHASRELWEMTRAELVPFASTFPVSQVHDTGPRSYREEDMHAYTLSRRHRETHPPFVPIFELGTWSLDSCNGVWHLRRYSLKDLVFPGGDPYATSWEWSSDVQLWLVEKYVSWLLAGYEPPALQACETEKGKIKVLNGHNRAASLARIGRHEAMVWVSPAYTKPNGFCTDLTHALALEIALHEGKQVPHHVIAEYPHLAQNPCM